MFRIFVTDREVYQVHRETRILTIKLKHMYQAVVIPYGVPEEWVLNVLFGSTDEERLMEIASQLLEVGVRTFTITHYSPIRDTGVMIAIEDICLN